MSDKRFPPTEKRRREARRQGKVASSPLLIRAALLVGCTGSLGALWGRRADLLEWAKSCFSDELALGEALARAGVLATRCTLGLLVVFAFVLLAGVAHTGGQVHLGGLLAKRRPPQVVGWLLAAVMLALGLVAGRELLLHLRLAAPKESALQFSHLLTPYLAIGLVAFVLSALLDRLVDRARLRRELAMSRQEIEAERAEEESDPAMQRALRQRFSTAVSATVAAQILVVGTSCALALRQEGADVRVIKRGQGATAQTMRKSAASFSLLEIVDAELADGLSAVPVGQLLDRTISQSLLRRAMRGE